MGDVIEPPQMRERWLENARRDTPWIFAVVDCGLCDDYGYRGLLVCDHVDRTETAKRGMAKVRAALAKEAS